MNRTHTYGALVRCLGFFRCLGFAPLCVALAGAAAAAPPDDASAAEADPGPAAPPTATAAPAPPWPPAGALAPLPVPPGAEPPVEELCRAAVALALAEPERARSFVSRARLAGWLPEMHVLLRRRLARTEGLTYDATVAPTPVPVDVDGVDEMRYEWRASWDLSRMIFNPDELQAHVEALRMADARREIQTLVIRLYFERRRLWSEAAQAAGARGGASDAAAERRRLRMLELEAQLDALSGGAFSAAGARSGMREAPASP